MVSNIALLLIIRCENHVFIKNQLNNGQNTTTNEVYFSKNSKKNKLKRLKDISTRATADFINPNNGVIHIEFHDLYRQQVRKEPFHSKII